jgi:hypothetical protein
LNHWCTQAEGAMDPRDNSKILPRQQALLKLPDVCVYCGAPADTRDHVPPRLLLEEPLPLNLLTVPACRRCNNGYSDDERYVRDALHVVGFGEMSREKTAPGGVVARSLEHSPLLGQKMNRAHVAGENGRILFQPALDRFSRVMAKIGAGLWFGQYRRYMAASRFKCEAVEHTQRISSWLVDLASDRGKSPHSGWPEVGSRRLRCVAAAWPDQQVQRRPREWNKVQANVFEYLFVPKQPGQAGLLCIINLYDTVWGLVGCPPPPAEGRKRDRRQ